MTIMVIDFEGNEIEIDSVPCVKCFGYIPNEP